MVPSANLPGVDAGDERRRASLVPFCWLVPVNDLLAPKSEDRQSRQRAASLACRRRFSAVRTPPRRPQWRRLHGRGRRRRLEPPRRARSSSRQGADARSFQTNGLVGRVDLPRAVPAAARTGRTLPARRSTTLPPRRHSAGRTPPWRRARRPLGDGQTFGRKIANRDRCSGPWA